jgi:ribosomal protein L37AE/L43A
MTDDLQLSDLEKFYGMEENKEWDETCPYCKSDDVEYIEIKVAAEIELWCCRKCGRPFDIEIILTRLVP